MRLFRHERAVMVLRPEIGRGKQPFLHTLTPGACDGVTSLGHSSVQIEPGWECSGSSPSVCRRLGTSASAARPDAPDGVRPSSSAWQPDTDGALLPELPGGGWRQGDHDGGGVGAQIAAGFVVLAAVVAALALAGVLFMKWDAICEALPQA